MKLLKAMRGVAGVWKPHAKRRAAARCARFLSGVYALASKAPPPPDSGLLISFIAPILDALPAHLDDLLASFRCQRSGIGELLLCDGGSVSKSTRDWLSRHDMDVDIRTVRSIGGLGGALTAGLSAARAPWIARLDAAGALAPFAVDRMAWALADNPECQFLYCDEVIADEKLRPVEAVLKPAWDPVMLSGIDYVSRLALYRRARVIEIGAWRGDIEATSEHEAALRYLKGLDSHKIRHLPYPAYIERRSLQARASAPRRRSAQARTRWPSVSVIIPSRNALPLIDRVLHGLFEETDYPGLEVIIVDNGTTDLEVLALYQDYAAREPRFRVEIRPAPFNFSRAVNRGFGMAKGERVLLLNNDVEIRHPDWLKEMESCFDYDGVGIVGAKLLYPDRTLQHAGVIAGLGGYAGHWFVGQREDYRGPMGRLGARQSMSVVTGACMLVSRECWQAVGPFDEDVFPVAYNDVDFCLRAGKAGYRVIWTPFATLIHHESVSRGSDETQPNIERFLSDKANLRARHRTDIIEDRAFNPWYSKGESVPHPVLLGALPQAR